MPSEPFPWDRRDFRRHDRSGSYRWREQNHHPNAPPYHHHQQQQRCYSDFRSSRPLPPGHSKQGGWHMYSDEAGNGFMPFGSRYGDRSFEDENCRSFVPRGDGRYFRNSRENRVPFTQKEWKSPSSEPSPPIGPGIPTTEVNNLRSTENTRTCQNNSSKSSDISPLSDLRDLSDKSQSLLKEHHDKNGVTADGPGNSRQKSEKENCQVSVDWKPLKWVRSGSLSSRGSSFSHSGSSKSLGVDPTETVAEVEPENASPIDSPSALSDETSSRKKPRLGWGEGLAKYEKKKVEGPEDCVINNGLVVSVSNTETLQSPAVSLHEKNLRVASLSDCASPVTPSSVACSFSPGIVEKESVTEANVDHGTTDLSCSPSTMSQTCYGGPTFNLENLELTSTANLSSLIKELVQSDDDPSSSETGYVRTTSMNKLMVLKVNILKALEMTEFEIDSLETEVKSLTAKPTSCCPLPSETAECVESSMNLDMSNFNELDEKCSKNGIADNHVINVRNSCEDLASVRNVHSDVDDTYDSIFAPNQDFANRALKELNNLLPSKHCPIDISTLSSVSDLQRDSSVVKERFQERKRFLQFKEKVLALKFKVFQHFWKEGRIVSIRKLRVKAQKKFDLSRSAHKKNRSSSRSRISCSAGGLQTVPADEVIEFINGLLSESPFKPYRSSLKMPPLILDKEMMRISRFISSNGLVEDPCAVEKERSMINPWTSQEKDIFINKLATFGKDFKKISSFLNHKTIADCIEFYYKNHKSERFEKIRKKPDFIKEKKSQSTTYLVASGKRWNNRETNAANVESSSSYKAPKSEYDPSKRSNGQDIYSNERETAAVDVLAGICGSLSSEAMSSCITTSVDHGVGSTTKRPLTPEVDVDDEYSDWTDDEMGPTDWTDDEKSTFVRAVLSYGMDFVMLSQCVGTRSHDQCKVFFSKARKCLGLDLLILPGGGNDVNGGDSDIEDSCAVEMGTVINGSESKMEEDLPPSDMKSTNESNIVRTEDFRGDFKISEENIIPDSNEDGKEENGSNIACESLHELGTMIVSSNNESERGVEEEYAFGLPNGSSEAENKDLVEVSDGKENQEQEFVVLVEENLNSKKDEDRDFSSCEISDANLFRYENTAEIEKSRVTSLQQNGHLASVKSSSLSSVPIRYQKDPKSSNSDLMAVGANGISDTHSRTICRTSDCQKNLSVSDTVESSLILRGYPVSVDINGNRKSTMQNVPKWDENSHSDRYKEFSLQKCNGSRQHSTVVDALFQSSADVEKPSRNGDVKLFGKVIISSHQKPNSCADQKANIDSTQSKSDFNNSVRSFGFWDGNRIQTVFPPVLDSTRLLAKYPAAFSNYAVPTMKLEQTPLMGPPFTIDMKSPPEVLFSEMQRRNGFDLVSGISVVGVSDPVAAIKLHYAKAGQISLQKESVIKEDDRWRSNGDLGR